MKRFVAVLITASFLFLSKAYGMGGGGGVPPNHQPVNEILYSEEACPVKKSLEELINKFRYATHLSNYEPWFPNPCDSNGSPTDSKPAYKIYCSSDPTTQYYMREI